MNLAVVIPIYNEERTIQALLSDLFLILTEEKISYVIFIINDGSTDNTLSQVESMQDKIPNINIITKTNSGHGPSLFIGYSLATKHDWVLQIDSDYAYDLSAFKELWSVKDDYDLLLAERKIRNVSFYRKLITSFLKFLVSALYGNGVEDINVPYRLIRSDKLQQLLHKITPSQFAPNVLMTAFFIKRKFRIFLSVAEIRNISIVRKSKLTPTIFKGCFKSILDVITFRLKI